MLTTAWDIINYVGDRQVIHKIIQYHVFAPNPLCQTTKSPHKPNHSMSKSSNHREISRKYHRELNTINENIYMLILTGFKNRLCHGPGERSAHRHGKPANEYKFKPGQWKMRNWKQEKVKTGSDCTANSGPFPNQYQHIYIYLTLQHDDSANVF